MSLTEIYTLSLHDALPIFNAITHANASDPEKRVFIDYSVSYEPDPPDFIVTVRDQGPGFDPDTLKNPLTPENMLNTSGRGIFLIRQFMDDVSMRRAPQGGMEVRMTKHIRPTE